jgi:hypothetical protein
MSPEAAADEAEKLLAGGFRSVKLRLGHTTLEEVIPTYIPFNCDWKMYSLGFGVE